MFLTLLHSERPKLYDFGLSECNRVKQIYSQLSLSQSRRDPLKHFEIPVLRHIRCAELRKIPIKPTKFHKLTCNLTPLVRNIC